VLLVDSLSDITRSNILTVETIFRYTGLTMIALLPRTWLRHRITISSKDRVQRGTEVYLEKVQFKVVYGLTRETNKRFS
jgi:hypothetical protein